jgi:hypothetical protein
MTAEQVVFSANDRCDQENLIAQLKSGVHALTKPVDDLVSNWAYMVMASLAWSLKAWAALLLSVSPRHAAKHGAEKLTLLRMEFATFRAALIEMPCQIVRGGKRLICSAVVVDPVARSVLATGGAVARQWVVLRRGELEVGVRMPRSAWAFANDDEVSSRCGDGRRDLRAVEGTR